MINTDFCRDYRYCHDIEVWDVSNFSKKVFKLFKLKVTREQTGRVPNCFIKRINDEANIGGMKQVADNIHKISQS